MFILIQKNAPGKASRYKARIAEVFLKKINHIIIEAMLSELKIKLSYIYFLAVGNVDAFGKLRYLTR